MATGKIQRPIPTAANVGAVSLTGLYGKFVIEQKSADNISVAKLERATGNISCAKSGYTWLGIVGVGVTNATSSGAGQTYVVANVMKNGNNAYYDLKNHHSSTAAKVKIVIDCLYVKNS